MLKPDQSLISSLLAIISNKLSYFLLSLCFSAALFLQGASVPPDSHRFLWDANILLGICLRQWHKLGTWISLLCRGTDLNFRFTSRISPGLCRVIGGNVFCLLMFFRWQRLSLTLWITVWTAYLDRRMWTWLSGALARPVRNCWWKMYVFLSVLCRYLLV